jgi:WD40 repeat protein
MDNERTASYHREQRVEEVLAVYLEAVRLGQAPDRRELLARHPDLAAELEDFFADHDLVRDLAEPLRQGAALAHTPSPAAADTVTSPADRLPHRFGDYELLVEIARGGMGIVYRARQISLNRVVALKMIVPGGRPPGEIERFLHTEAQAVASLDHPNIVPIYEAGTHDGRPFFSMKLIDGGNLTQWLRDASPKPQRSVARLMAAVARAVHHAHQRGILHRDLKPSNVLLDQAGQPHVTDFGLARRVEVDTAVSQSGTISGTPAYMAPEQALGDRRQTTAVDVYGLGAVLYELLTGRPPFWGETPLDTLLQARTREVPRPRALDRRIDRALETLCLKCLEKDPARRYGSAEALADDLDRWLDGEPIRARRTGSWERALLWAKRRPAVAVLAGSILILCLCLFGFALWGWQNAVLAEEAANGRASAEEQARQAAQKEAKALDKARREEAARAEEALRKQRLVEAHLALERAMNHCQRDEIANGLLWLAHGLEVVPEDETELQFSFRCLLAGWSRQLHTLKRVLPIASELHVALSPDGKMLATSHDKPACVQLSDAVTGRPLGQPIPLPGPAWHVAFGSKDYLIIACYDTAGLRNSIRCWALANCQPVGEPILLAQAAGDDRLDDGLAVSPDGKRLVTFPKSRGRNKERDLRLWEVPTGKPIGKPLPAKHVRTAVFSPDSKTLLTGSFEKPYEIRFWDAQTGKPVGKPVELNYATTAVAFSPNGKNFMIGGVRIDEGGDPPGCVQLFETATRELIPGCDLRFPTEITQLAFSPDGETSLALYWGDRNSILLQMFRWHRGFVGSPMATASHPNGGFAFSADSKAVLQLDELWQARLWDTQTGESLGAIPQAGELVQWVGCDPTSNTLLTASGADVRCWEIAAPAPGRKLDWPQGRGGYSVAFHPDGTKFAMTVYKDADSEVRFWDRTTAKPTGEPIPFQGPKEVVQCVAWSPDGKVLLTVAGSDPAKARLWDAVTHQPIGESVVVQWPSIYLQFRGYMTAFSPDSKRVVLVAGKVARLYDTATGKPAGKPFEHDDLIRAVAFSPDGKLVLTGGDDKTARVWEATTGQRVGKALTHASAVQFVAFSPDGKKIIASEESTARLWNVATGRPIGEPIRQVPPAFGLPLSFSRNSKTVLISGPDGGTARLWNAETGKPYGRYLRGPTILSSMGFSPDGRTIVTAGLNGMQIWDAATGRPVGKVLRKFRANPRVLTVELAVFSPDSRSLVVKTDTAQAGFSEAWLVEVPQPLTGGAARVRTWIEVITGRELDAGGEVADLDATAWQERHDHLQKLGGPPAP